jgi:hypothetical protein
MEVMKRKTGNLRTTMRIVWIGRGLEVLTNGQEQNGENSTDSTSELVQWSGQLQTMVVTLLISVKFDLND